MWQWWEWNRWVVPVVPMGVTVDDKVGEDNERYVRESSPQPGRRLKRGKGIGRRETGRKETVLKKTG